MRSIFLKIYYRLRHAALIKIAIFCAPILKLLAVKHIREYGDVPRILLIPQLTRIGDLVCTTPTFREIKKKYPKSFLAVLTTNKIAGIIRSNPDIDEIITFKSIDFVSRVLPEISKKKFDWCFGFTPSPVASIVAIFGLIPRRVKLTRRPRPFSEFVTDWLNTEAIRYEHHTYLPRHYLRMLAPLGINVLGDGQVRGEVYATEIGNQKIGNWLRENRIKKDDLVVGISITTGNKIKEWGDENSRKVAEYAVQKYGAKVIFLGAKADGARIDAFFRRCNTNLRINANLQIRESFFKAVDFSLEELPSLMKRLNLYIACDTGPIYIAHALGVSLVDIIGPVDPREQPPKDEKSIHVLPEGNVPPSSFVLKRAGSPRLHHRALAATKFEQVATAVDTLLATDNPAIEER